jgi:hypothetical protein
VLLLCAAGARAAVGAGAGKAILSREAEQIVAVVAEHHELARVMRLVIHAAEKNKRGLLSAGDTCLTFVEGSSESRDALQCPASLSAPTKSTTPSSRGEPAAPRAVYRVVSRRRS